jgi:hypothetical protein
MFAELIQSADLSAFITYLDSSDGEDRVNVQNEVKLD